MFAKRLLLGLLGMSVAGLAIAKPSACTAVTSPEDEVATIHALKRDSTFTDGGAHIQRSGEICLVRVGYKIRGGDELVLSGTATALVERSWELKTLSAGTWRFDARTKSVHDRMEVLLAAGDAVASVIRGVSNRLAASGTGGKGIESKDDAPDLVLPGTEIRDCRVLPIATAYVVPIDQGRLFVTWQEGTPPFKVDATIGKRTWSLADKVDDRHADVPISGAKAGEAWEIKVTPRIGAPIAWHGVVGGKSGETSNEPDDEAAIRIARLITNPGTDPAQRMQLLTSLRDLADRSYIGARLLDAAIATEGGFGLCAR